jgi:hypothetical protein
MGSLLRPQVLTNHCPDQMNLVIVLNLLHTRTCGLSVGPCPPQPASLLGPTPTLSPSFLLAQAIFEPNLFLYKYPNILNPSHYNIHNPSHSSYLLTYEDGTDRVFRNNGIQNSDAGDLPRRKHTTTFFTTYFRPNLHKVCGEI